MKVFYTPREFAAAFGVGLTKTYALIGAGLLEARKAERKTLITAESAERWAASLPAFRSGAANARQPQA